MLNSRLLLQVAASLAAGSAAELLARQSRLPNRLRLLERPMMCGVTGFG